MATKKIYLNMYPKSESGMSPTATELIKILYPFDCGSGVKDNIRFLKGLQWTGMNWRGVRVSIQNDFYDKIKDNLKKYLVIYK